MRSLAFLLLALALGVAILSRPRTAGAPADVRLVDGSLAAVPESASDDVPAPPRALAPGAVAPGSSGA